MILLLILQALLLTYLGGAALYLLGYALAGFAAKARRDEQVPPHEALARIAVFIPAYREDAVILHSAREALRLDYPTSHWRLVVVADGLQPGTLMQLRQLPLEVVVVHFDKSTKSKALNAAMGQLGGSYDLALIFDADNIGQTDILYRISHLWQRGYRAIQCRRVAKNLDTPFAVLDAMSEEINNHIFSAGHRACGLSSRLVGSGMAFDYGLFREVMATVDAVGGFDKELELKLLGRGIEVAYLPSVRVWDEKVSQAQVFAGQRRRWIAAQFHYARHYFGPALGALLRQGNIDYFDKACQMMLPPRLMLPGLLLAGALLALLLGGGVWAWLWGAAFAANALAFALAIPRHLYRRQYLRAFLHLPRAFGVMALALLRLRGSNRQFIHTPHRMTH
ncbi:MAG: glycosyltransferase family 2 protein [Bacteroidia bacterium]